MSQKFKTALRLVLISEGILDGKSGNVDHPDDEGGRTGAGILQTEYDKWLSANDLPHRDVWDMPEKHRTAIYKANYWDPMVAEKMPLTIGYMAFDAAVLHGVGFAPKAIQKALNVKVDGEIGPMTLAAANAIHPDTFRDRLRQLRWARMQSRKSFPTFKAGWEKRLNDVDRNVRQLLKLKG